MKFRLCLTSTIDYLLNIFNFLCQKIEKGFLDFQDFSSGVSKSGSLSIWFIGFIFPIRLLVLLEVFQNFIDFLRRFNQNKKRDLVYSSQYIRTFTTLVLADIYLLGLRSKLFWNLFPKRNVIVNNKRIPFWLTERRDELPYCFTYIFEIIDIICLTIFDFYCLYKLQYKEGMFWYCSHQIGGV